MNNKPNIKVSNSQEIISTIVGINIFLFIMMIVISLIQQKFILPMYIIIILLVTVPSVFALMWINLFSVVANERTITVRRWSGSRFSFDISEIISVQWKIVDTDFIHTEKITVNTANKRFSVDTAMNGFDQLAGYIQGNVDNRRIQYIKKDNRKNK